MNEIARISKPERVHWCDGSRREYETSLSAMMQCASAIALDPKRWRGCYLFRSDPSDVARVEQRTFVCSSSREEAGTNNNWMAPDEMTALMLQPYRGCMKGRTLCVIP